MRTVLVGLLLALVVVPPSRADPAKLVLGRSIGAASIGETEKSVRSAYGKPGSLKNGNYGGRPFALATYTVGGGKLQVYYDRATRKVVGLATTSARYRTSGGFGVGSPAAAAGALGFAWNAQCTVTYLKSSGGMMMEVFTRSHLRTAPVVEIYFIRAAYAGEC